MVMMVMKEKKRMTRRAETSSKWPAPAALVLKGHTYVFIYGGWLYVYV